VPTDKNKIQAYVEDDLYQQLADYAARLDVSVSKAVERALQAFFSGSHLESSAADVSELEHRIKSLETLLYSLHSYVMGGDVDGIAGSPGLSDKVRHVEGQIEDVYENFERMRRIREQELSMTYSFVISAVSGLSCPLPESPVLTYSDSPSDLPESELTPPKTRRSRAKKS
jgi:hypothetical protein